MCLREFSVLTAFGVTVEVRDWNRFSGKSVGAFLGLVPLELLCEVLFGEEAVWVWANGVSKRHPRLPGRLQCQMTGLQPRTKSESWLTRVLILLV